MTIELANRLAELRKQKGLSQEELADRLGVSRQAISKWERGEASPDTDNLIELAKIYDISLDELVGLSSSNKEEPKEEPKEESANSVRIDDDGIHIVDDEGQRIEITGDKVHYTDIDGKKVCVNRPSKARRLSVLVYSITTLLVTIAYLLLGSLLGLWGQAWTLFLLIPIVPTLAEAIIFKNANIFAYPIFLAFVYLTLCAWILPAFDLNKWHPLWVMFLTVPVYYGVCNFIKPKVSYTAGDSEDDED